MPSDPLLKRNLSKYIIHLKNSHYKAIAASYQVVYFLYIHPGKEHTTSRIKIATYLVQCAHNSMHKFKPVLKIKQGAGTIFFIAALMVLLYALM